MVNVDGNTGLSLGAKDVEEPKPFNEGGGVERT